AGTFVAVADSKSDARISNAHDDAANADQESPEIVLARAAIQDDTPVFRPAERDIWFHELARVRDADEAELHKSSLANVAYLQLHKQPADYRGKLVSVKGSVRLAYPTRAAENELGVKEYCVYVLQPVGQPDALIFVYALYTPVG